MGILAIVGLAVMAAASAWALAAAADAASAEQLYTRARQAYQEGRRMQALTDALAAHEKNPEDVRVKYLVYLLRQEPGTGGPGTDDTNGTDDDGEDITPITATGRKPVTITEEETQALIKKEGIGAIRQFQPIQRILQRRCADGKCHGSLGTGAKWVLALKGSTNQQMLAENFRIVSQYINRENPEQSPLLTKPLGGKEAGHPEKSIRGKTDPIYQQILKYIPKLKTKADIIWDDQ
jgi:type II secretory pathway pseudopilin PulG